MIACIHKLTSSVKSYILLAIHRDFLVVYGYESSNFYVKIKKSKFINKMIIKPIKGRNIGFLDVKNMEQTLLKFST